MTVGQGYVNLVSLKCSKALTTEGCAGKGNGCFFLNIPKSVSSHLIGDENPGFSAAGISDGMGFCCGSCCVVYGVRNVSATWSAPGPRSCPWGGEDELME